MKLIEDWLKGGQNYAVGVRLYMQYGRDKNLQRLFTSEGETPFKKQKLVAALKDLVAGEPSAKTAPVPTSITTTQDAFVKTWPASANTDDVLQDLWNQARLLLKEIAEIHGKLDVVPDDEQRRKLAFELLRKDEQLDEVYNQRDFYQKHGKPMATEPTFQIITDPWLMAKRLANLKRYIRREKQAVAKDAANQAAADRLKQYTTEFNIYAAKIGIPLC